MGARPHLEVWPVNQDWQDGRLRRCLGVKEAAEALAETAQIAGSEPHAIWVGIWNRAVRRRDREGFVAELRSGPLEQPGHLDRRKRRRWKLITTQTLEWISARPAGPAQVASDTPHPAAFL